MRIRQNSEKILYLIGGKDLEMEVILQLLESNGYRKTDDKNYKSVKKGYVDKQLFWGASVTDYEEFFDFPGQIYGVELGEPPGWKALANYHRIDHHNELSHLPASIEQVAHLFGVTLNRHQKLVAANDKGYIPAMKAMGASEYEISEIRRADRKAQGVTDKDEEKARESIEKNLVWSNGIAVVKSLTEKFSPITDRLYGKAKKLLVHTDKKLVYYGEGSSDLSEYFIDHIKSGKAYVGGGSNGYLGFTEDNIDLMSIKRKILERLALVKSHE